MPPQAMPPAPSMSEAPMPPGSEPPMEIGEGMAETEAAPKPKSPLSVSAIKGLIGQFNETVDAFGGADLPNLEWTPPEGTKAKWTEPLPDVIFAPLLALDQALGAVAGGEFEEKHGFEPSEIVDDRSLRGVTVKLKQMSKDKKLIEAMQAPLQAEAPMEAPAQGAPLPSQMSEADKEMMQNMG